MHKSVDIVILNYNTPDITAKCLRSIKRFTDLTNVRIKLWDNGSRDHSRSFFTQAEWKWIEYHYSPENLGFAKACNAVMRESTADYVLLLNSDTEVLETGWLEALVQTCDEMKAGVVGCKLIYPHGLIQHAGGFIKPGWEIGPHCGDHYGRGAQSHEETRIRTDIDFVTGACFLIPRSTIETIGYLDERFFFAGEDVDYCQRIKAAGLPVVYTGHVMLMHYEGYSFKKEQYEHGKTL